MTRENPDHAEVKENDMGSYGLTAGTRHYIQFNLVEGEGWKDLLFQDSEGEFKGLWASRSYGAANARIEELMAECMTDRSQYRIVRRTWDETVIEHNPNHGLAYNDPNFYDPEQDPDNDEDAAAEADLESQVGEVPDSGDEPPVNTPVANPLIK